MTVGRNDVSVAVEFGVSEPEETPNLSILRVDTDGLAIGVDSIVVTLLSVVSEPAEAPGKGTFRPLPEPIKHPHHAVLPS